MSDLLQQIRGMAVDGAFTNIGPYVPLEDLERVLEGMVLVPREPTEEMFRAACRFHPDRYVINGIYRNLLAALPAQPQDQSAPAAGEKRLNTMSNARAPDNGEGLAPELANITLSRELIEMILRDFKAAAAHAPVEDRIFFNSTGKLIADALSIAGRCNKGKGGLYRIEVMDRREECPDFERKRKAPAPTATPGEGED